MQPNTFLITTDFHGNRKALASLAELLKERHYDAVIMAGDLINPDHRELPYVTDFIDLIKEHNLPLFGLHGNNEPEPAYQIYRQTGINIHLETKQFNGYNICGIGSFGYLNENGFEDLAVSNLVINQQTIFVTHVPPRKVEAQAHGPLVHIFGHKHVLAFTKQVGETLQIQCPAGVLGKVTELELPSKKVRFIDLPNFKA
jgi:Icc-related predicted phosphoesterase